MALFPHLKSIYPLAYLLLPRCNLHMPIQAPSQYLFPYINCNNTTPWMYNLSVTSRATFWMGFHTSTKMHITPIFHRKDMHACWLTTCCWRIFKELSIPGTMAWIPTLTCFIAVPSLFQFLNHSSACYNEWINVLHLTHSFILFCGMCSR